MRRFLLLIEVTDKGQDAGDGSAVYTLHGADMAARQIKGQLKRYAPDGVDFNVKVTAELIP